MKISEVVVTLFDTYLNTLPEDERPTDMTTFQKELDAFFNMIKDESYLGDHIKRGG